MVQARGAGRWCRQVNGNNCMWSFDKSHLESAGEHTWRRVFQSDAWSGELPLLIMVGFTLRVAVDG